MDKKKLFMGLLLLVVILGLTACSGMPFSRTSHKTDPARANFFRGTEGVMMRIDPNSPPANMYYYEAQPYEQGYGYEFDPNSNNFDIFVDLHNIGASWTKGGLYVSGYDPNMIRINEIDIPRISGWADCGLQIATGNPQATSFFDSLGFSVSCAGLGGVHYYDQNNYGLQLNNLGNLFSTVTNENYEDRWWSNVGLAYQSQSPTGQGDFVFQMEFGDFSRDNLNRGRGMLMLLAGLSFQRYNGIEYILAPNDYDFPGGEQTTIPFTGSIYTWPQGLDKLSQATFLVTNCYVYTTYAAPTVCIDPQPQSLGDKVCIPRDIIYSGGSGAPVGVTRIEQENTQYTVRFTIHVKDLNTKGQVFDLLQMEKCSPYYPGRLSSSFYDKVYLLDARIGSQRLQCTPSYGDGIRLTNGEGILRCTYYMDFSGTRSAYEKQLILEFGIGYIQS